MRYTLLAVWLKIARFSSDEHPEVSRLNMFQTVE